MADRAAQALEMDLGKAVMPRERSAEPAGEPLPSLPGVLSEMTAGAGQVLSGRRGTLLALPFEAADHIVPDPVPVTAHALEPGGGVDVLVELVLRGPGRGRAVTRQASAVVRFVRDVEESPVFGVEKGRVIADGRDDGPFPVVRIRAVEEVPCRGKPRGHAADLAEARGGRRGPAEVLPHDLPGPFAGILTGRRVVAAHAVDLEPAGNVPSRIGRGGLGRGLGDPAAREVTGEETREFPVGQADRSGRPRAGPLPVGERDHRPGPLVGPDPGFARRSGGHILPARIEVEPFPDDVVVVAGRAGEPGRERKGIGFGRDDLLVELVLERDPVDGADAASVPRGDLIVGGGRGDARQHDGEDDGQGGALGPHALKCSGRNRIMDRDLTASLTLRTATALS